MRIATAEQMRHLDYTAIHERGISSVDLMEQAATGLCAACLNILNRSASNKCIIMCGSGNNGGDGLATARLLLEHGNCVQVFLVGKREKMTDDSREMERRLIAAGGILEDYDPVATGDSAFGSCYTSRTRDPKPMASQQFSSRYSGYVGVSRYHFNVSGQLLL